MVISYAKLQNKCINVRERVEVVEWNKRLSLPSPAVLWIVSVCERKPWKKKKIIFKICYKSFIQETSKKLYTKYREYRKILVLETWPFRSCWKKKTYFKICGVHSAIFLKYTWPFFNIMKEKVHETFQWTPWKHFSY